MTSVPTMRLDYNFQQLFEKKYTTQSIIHNEVEVYNTTEGEGEINCKKNVAGAGIKMGQEGDGIRKKFSQQQKYFETEKVQRQEPLYL